MAGSGSRHWSARLFAIAIFSLLLTPAIAGPLGLHKVHDLYYGEMLFHYYQDDYFTAISHGLAAGDQERLPRNQDNVDLLLGGLYLSYGLHNEEIGRAHV